MRVDEDAPVALLALILQLTNLGEEVALEVIATAVDEVLGA
jgi:hypothetical protein